MDLCEGLPYAEECFPFNEETLVYKVGGKMFALIPLEKNGIIILKHSSENIAELKESHHGISEPAYLSKNHWIQVDTKHHGLHRHIKDWIETSYNLVVAGLPKKEQQKYLA
jgi:predicted DNA-binding protein (MmcQ/YjbR family)